MALDLAAITLVNPTKVTTTTQTLGARNMTYVGPTIYHHKLADIDSARKLVQHIITVEWELLGATELTTLVTAYHLACEDYVQLLMDGLEVISAGHIGESVFVMAQQSGLNVQFSQGSTPTGEGPVIYDVKAIFVSQPTFTL